jgi:hypothetical protein
MQLAARSYILTTILLLIFFYSQAQSECKGKEAFWKDPMNFIPAEDSPTFFVRVNYVIPQKKDGSGNYTASDPEHEFLLRKSIDIANWHWKELTDPRNKVCYTGDDFISSTYVQFVLNEFIYFQDDYYWNAENGAGCPNDGNWFLNDLEIEIRKNPKYDRAINIYLPNDSSDYDVLVLEKTFRDEPKGKPGCSELPTVRDLDRSSRICLGNDYNQFWWLKNVVIEEEALNPKMEPWSVLQGWNYSGRGNVLAHELGHSMGLSHGNEYHGLNKCHESIMNQLFVSPHNYLQPSEIGKMHLNLRVSNIRDFLQEDVYVKKPIIIEENRVLEIDFKAYEDIVIKDGATLIIRCKLSLPAEAEVIVEPGGKLILDGGILHSRSTSETDVVIQLQEKRSCFLKSKAKRKKGAYESKGKSSLSGSIEMVKVK